MKSLTFNKPSLPLFISHVALIDNNTAEENMEPAKPTKVNEVLQVSVWIWLKSLNFLPSCFHHSLISSVSLKKKEEEEEAVFKVHAAEDINLNPDT